MYNCTDNRTDIVHCYDLELSKHSVSLVIWIVTGELCLSMNVVDVNIGTERIQKNFSCYLLVIALDEKLNFRTKGMH
jgi:hypothetical protein